MGKILVLALLLGGCVHHDRSGPAGESVPVPRAVQDNAYPRDFGPVVPPVPPTSRSGQVPNPFRRDAGPEQVFPVFDGGLSAPPPAAIPQ